MKKHLSIILIVVFICFVNVVGCDRGNSVNQESKLEYLLFSSLLSYPTSPSFSHESGVYDTDISVSLSTDDPFSTIRYSLDGDDISFLFNSEEYKSPINIAGEGAHVIIRAQSENILGWSNIVTHEYIIEKTKCHTPVFEPGDGYSEVPRTINITSTVGASIKYTNDGSDPRSSITAITGDSFTIDSLTTISAYAFKSGLLDSDVSNIVINVVKSFGYPSVDEIVSSSIALLSDGRPVVSLHYYTSYYADPKTEVFMLGPDNRWLNIGEFKTFYAAIKIGSDDIPVIFYKDNDDSGIIKVKKWVIGTDWRYLGSPGSYGSIDNGVIGPDNKPSFAYSNCLRQWQYGTTWNEITYSSLNGASCLSLAIGPDNKPVIIFVDSGSRKPSIIRWESNAWTGLGTINSRESLQCRIAVGSDNRPVILFQEQMSNVIQDVKARVMKWNSGTDWTDLGYAVKGEGTNIYLALDSNNNPMVMYSLNIYKWSYDQVWNGLGTFGYSGGGASSVAIAPDNNPVVVFNDTYHNDKPHVVKCKYH